MEMFGIELRRVGDISALYKDVDRVLVDFNLAKVQRLSIAHSFHKMLRSDSYLSVCTIQKCAEVAQIAIPKEHLDIYQTQHCISWNEMLPEFRQTLIAMLLNDFRSILNPTEVEAI